jgi:hypothetical protein
MVAGAPTCPLQLPTAPRGLMLLTYRTGLRSWRAKCHVARVSKRLMCLVYHSLTPGVGFELPLRLSLVT